MGIASVAVYSTADKDGLWVSFADESVCIGGAKSKDSYLDMNKVISAALITGAEAVHPGYGFLSENAEFAKKCAENKLIFIGPDPEVITKMGDKNIAKITMKKAGVPVIPGCELVKDINHGLDEAKKIGFPLLIKARSGGGGRGIRIVGRERDFEAAFMAAGAEAQSCFGDGGLYLEKYLTDVKHIEMQIIGDKFGNVVCMGERDCSMQRRNQKLIEEAPANIPHLVRSKMISASVKAGKAVNYVGVGTIEYLYTREGKFYFMEMNTRLQVEHPVTEMVTNKDLVKWQIRVAAGNKLNFNQLQIKPKGHAIECRINNENLLGGGNTGPNKITMLHVPGGPWVRFDTAIYHGYTIPPFYDSMIGKLIVWSTHRDKAIRKMKAALCELILEGVANNIELQYDLLDTVEFDASVYTTDFVNRNPLNMLEGEKRQNKALEKAAEEDKDNITCESCKKRLKTDELNKNLFVCANCGNHFRIGARDRIFRLVDVSSFTEMFEDLHSHNVLEFEGYDKKLAAAKACGEEEAVITGTAMLNGNKTAIFAMEPNFMMGSMGSIVGERITRLFEFATEQGLPVVGFSVSGGARMQEGILSLMQMAKTSGAVKKHSEAGQLFISVLTNPTTGGVTASFASLGDIIVAEPGALIGFAGPRVIEQTIRKKLPVGFQRAEFVVEKGFVDTIIERARQKDVIGTLLQMHKKAAVIAVEKISEAKATKGAEDRATFLDYLGLFNGFIELHGDRGFGDDKAIIGGVAYMDKQPVTVIGIERGKQTKDKILRNFGMPHPEGYRKALRLMKQAEKFARPIINFIDTSGAYCGMEAEERGQGQAIAENLAQMMDLSVPVLSIIIGEGGSGGALALAVANEVYMLENSIYSVISPEGCASILWKDASKVAEACKNLKCISLDLKNFSVIEKIISEPGDQAVTMEECKKLIKAFLNKYKKLSADEIKSQRYKRFRKLGYNTL
ncbi:pyruvate carboxylase subunit a [Holotrichia oblita]|nr:pyruvate carboxylase subunit a [Holotrichia oblita]